MKVARSVLGVAVLLGTVVWEIGPAEAGTVTVELEKTGLPPNGTGWTVSYDDTNVTGKLTFPPSGENLDVLTEKLTFNSNNPLVLTFQETENPSDYSATSLGFKVSLHV